MKKWIKVGLILGALVDLIFVLPQFIKEGGLPYWARTSALETIGYLLGRFGLLPVIVMAVVGIFAFLYWVQNRMESRYRSKHNT